MNLNRHFTFRNIARRLLPIFYLCLACLGGWSPLKLSAQTVSDDDLKKINFDQKTGAQVSLDLPFRDESGKTVRLGDCFHGKPAILILGYYHCPMLCSFVLNGMIGSLQDLQWKVGDQFEVIDVSIDPHETPDLAAAKKANYVRRYGRADSGYGWHFLTGDEPAIRKLASEVGFSYVYDPKSNEYAHPSGLVILTPQGVVAHYFFGVVFSTPELKQSLRDASVKKVSPTLAQFILLCFHYSPITGKYSTLVLIAVRVVGAVIFLALVAFITQSVTRERSKANRLREQEIGKG